MFLKLSTTTKKEEETFKKGNDMGIPIKRRIETKRPGIVRQVGKLGVGNVIKLKAHRINRSPTFFPELFFDGIHCGLRETQKVFKFMFDI